LRDSCYLMREDSEKEISGEDFICLLHAVLEKGVSLKFKAKGFSMTPFIKGGDVITLAPFGRADYLSLGSVVAFIKPETKHLVVHRIVGRTDNGFIIKGDNVKEPHDIVPGTNVLGLVKKVERNGRQAYAALGPEKRVQAFLSRNTNLLPTMVTAWRQIRNLLGIKTKYE